MCEAGQRVQEIKDGEKENEDPKKTAVSRESKKIPERRHENQRTRHKQGTKIDMTLRLQWGTRDEEMMNSTGTLEEWGVKWRTSEPFSEISGIEDVKLGEVTDHKKKGNLKVPYKRSDERMEGMMPKEMNSASERSHEKIEKVMQNISGKHNGANGSDDGKIERNDATTSQCSTPDEHHNRKMKEDGEDKYGKINEKIFTMEKKKLTMLEDTNNRRSEFTMNIELYHKAQGEQNQRRAVATGFHDDTTKQEVKSRCKRTTKLVTHAFFQFFVDCEERDKYIRSANMLKSELRGRKRRISPAMDVEERHYQMWIWICSFCVNRTWREHDRHQTRTHNNCNDSSSQDRYWQIQSVWWMNTRIVSRTCCRHSTHIGGTHSTCTDCLAWANVIEKV